MLIAGTLPPFRFRIFLRTDFMTVIVGRRPITVAALADRTLQSTKSAGKLCFDWLWRLHIAAPPGCSKACNAMAMRMAMDLLFPSGDKV